MDRLRAGSPVYGRQRSGSSTGSSSPGGVSPSHHRSSSTSSAASAAGISNVRRTQNVAARAAAARLAQVMASQNAAAAAGDDDDEDDYAADHPPPPPARFGGSRVPHGSNGVSLLGRTARSPSPAVFRFRISFLVSAAAALLGKRMFRAAAMRKLLGRNIVEPPPAARSSSAGRPAVASRPTTTVVPPIKTNTTLRTPSPIPPVAVEPSADRTRQKRFDAGLHSSRDSGLKRESSTLQDELDMLQEENESVLEKLRLAEERCEEAEARAKELEKQVAALGEGVSLEARLLSRKEAALKQREAALKAARESKDGSRDGEVTTLRQELESAKEDAASAIDQLKEAESETKALRSMTQRMVLTQEEMEEVVLKRCWLARYWGLAVQYVSQSLSCYYGVHQQKKTEPCEAVIEFGNFQKELDLECILRLRYQSMNIGRHWLLFLSRLFSLLVKRLRRNLENKASDDAQGRNKLAREMSDIMGEGNIESMLSVEMGLRELSSLKVEDAVVVALGQHRRPSIVRQFTSDFKSPGEPKYLEAFVKFVWLDSERKLFLHFADLSPEEAEDVSFKQDPRQIQAWLIYFWRRAKTHGVEEDIADDRLQFWIGRNAQAPNSHDAIDVERGLTELRKLGIEQQLWDGSRADIEQASLEMENQ
ncbi:hypothetical protein U9M48_016624 [Paspalum notatum var. saurae]|uniref:Uncharacterized protein n=1 Tax=Paspalum notatum var. saurae TaxID=547442 RepID=A0AAQ3T7Z8_PASNO